MTNLYLPKSRKIPLDSTVKLLLIASGGALGALARFGVATVFASTSDSTKFPIGTLAANLFGCFLLGLLARVSESTLPNHPQLGPLLFTGILGGFTTFSTFSHEAGGIFREGQYGIAFAYIAASVVGGLFLAWLGFLLGTFKS